MPEWGGGGGSEIDALASLITEYIGRDYTE